MKNKTTKAIGAVGTFFSVAGCFGTFAAAPSLYAERYGIPNDLFVRLSELAMIGGGVTALAIAANTLLQRNERLQLSKAPRPKSPKPFHDHRAAKLSEVSLFREIVVREFGESEVASLETFRRWHRKNPSIFQLVVEIKSVTGAQKIVGVFKAVPISDHLIPHIELEEFTGTNIPDKFIVGPKETPAAFWLGDLVSVSRRNDVFVMGELRRFMLNNLRPGMRLFARGLTSVGLGYLRSFNFLCVKDFTLPEVGKTCALYPEDYDELWRRLSAGKASRARSKKFEKKVSKALRAKARRASAEAVLVAAAAA